MILLKELQSVLCILTWPGPHLQNIVNQQTQVQMRYGIYMSFSGMWNICLAHNATRLTLSNSMSLMLNFCVKTDNFCQCGGGIMQLHSSVSKQIGIKLSKRFHRWCHALPHHYFGGRYIFLQVHQVQSKAINNAVLNIKEHSAGELMHNISHLWQITKTEVNINQSINYVFCRINKT